MDSKVHETWNHGRLGLCRCLLSRGGDAGYPRVWRYYLCPGCFWERLVLLRRNGFCGMGRGLTEHRYPGSCCPTRLPKGSHPRLSQATTVPTALPLPKPRVCALKKVTLSLAGSTPLWWIETSPPFTTGLHWFFTTDIMWVAIPESTTQPVMQVSRR